MLQRRLAIVALFGLVGCGGSDDPEGVQVAPTVQVVPGAGLPPETMALDANNNLDVVRHDGRVYLAFRTAASHFAGPEATLNVVSSPTGDEKTWRFETRIALGRDVRECRFLSLGGKLFMYFAVLGQDPTKFEPQGMKMVELGPGGWSQPVDLYVPGFIPWRTKVVGGKAYLMGYVGGEHIYDGEHDPIYVHWLTTTDGHDLAPVVPEKPVIHTGGASETDFVIQDDGSVVLVLRDEAGDEGGWGSKICRMEAGALGTMRCAIDPRKYDSPILFRRGAAIYLIGRRNVTDTGNYDLMMRELDPATQTTTYLGKYSKTPKRCSLWKVDPDALSVALVVDLPSRGDTCFAGVLNDPDEVVVYNYTSVLDPGGPDLPWFAGQTRPTIIYRTVLTGL